MKYREDLIMRFWNERKMVHPNIHYAYDIVKELIDIAHLPEDTRLEFKEKLAEFEHHRIGTLELNIQMLDILYHRYHSEPLDEDVTFQGKTTKNHKLLLAVKTVVSGLSTIISEIAKLYSLEYASSQQEDEVEW